MIRRLAARFGLLALMLAALALSGCSVEPARATPANTAQGAQEPPPIPPEVRAAWRERLAKARATQIARIAEYRKAGRFPHNHRHNGYVPVFVDHRGVSCAVAYLMQRDGRGKDVTAIAAANNTVRIEDVTGGPLIDWILTSGLLQEEAAMIQPGYPRTLTEEWRVRGEHSRLVRHFRDVEQQLQATTERSLDSALERLAPRLQAGNLP